MKERDRYQQNDYQPQADELARARKQKHRKRFWQKALALVLAGVVVWGVLFLRQDIARLNLGMRLSDLLASYASGSGYPVELPTGQVLNTTAVGKDLALLTDTGLTLYNSQGKATGVYEHGYTSPICLANGDRVLIYDRGAKRLQVNSRSRQLFSQTYDYNISVANIGASGHIGVVTDAKYYNSCITVYDPEYDEIYIRETADMITGLSLNTDGSGMAVVSVDVNGGRLDSTITFFDFAKEEPVATLVLENQLVLSMEYAGREATALQVITDQQALLVSSAGKVESSYHFGGLFVNRFANNKSGGMFLLLDQLGDGNQLQLISLDQGLDLLGSLNLKERVQDMRLGDGYLCLYAGGLVTCYSLDLSQVQNTGLEGWHRIQPAGRNLYGISSQTLELFEPEVVAPF